MIIVMVFTIFVSVASISLVSGVDACWLVFVFVLAGVMDWIGVPGVTNLGGNFGDGVVF